MHRAAPVQPAQGRAPVQPVAPPAAVGRADEAALAVGALASDHRSALQMARDRSQAAAGGWKILTAEQKKKRIEECQQQIKVAIDAEARRICVRTIGESEWGGMSVSLKQSALRAAKTEVENRRQRAAENAKREADQLARLAMRADATRVCIEEMGQAHWDALSVSDQQIALIAAESKVQERRRKAAEDAKKKVSADAKKKTAAVAKDKPGGKKARAVDAPVQKTVEKKKVKRDPRKPKAPVSAYLYYCVDARLKTAESHPDLTPPERTKLMGQLWKKMSDAEKQPYAVKAAADKERHSRAMAEWDDPEAQSAREREDAIAKAAELAAAEEAQKQKTLKAEKAQKAASLAKNKATGKSSKKRIQKTAPKPKKRKAPEKPTGPPPSAGELSANHLTPQDGEIKCFEMAGVDGQEWASRFRLKWKREQLGWSGRRKQSPGKAVRKTKWPLQAAVDNKGWGEDFVLQFWYRRLQAWRMGPWQDADTDTGFATSPAEEAKASAIRATLLQDKAESMRQKPSWVLEQTVDDHAGEASQPAQIVKLTLPACGCPPSHSQLSKRRRTAMQDHLFERRPRAPRPADGGKSSHLSKAAKQRELQKKRKRLGLGDDGDHRRYLDGSFDRRSKTPAEAAIVEPAESPGSDVLAKEDWEEACRLPNGAGVDAQIRAMLGIMARRVELEHHQESRWLGADKEVDQAGRDNHTNHTVPQAIRTTVQDMIVSIGGIDAEARSVKRLMVSTLKMTQHSGYGGNDGRKKTCSLLEIYTALRDRRLCEYRKADDAADQGYLRKRRQVWDGLQNSKGLRWKGGDNLLIAVPYHTKTATVTVEDLAEIELPPPTVAQVSAGLVDFATPSSPGMKGILGKTLGLAAATCRYVRNGVLSVEFLDGDVLGGIPAEYGGLVQLPSAAFTSLEDRYWAKKAVQDRATEAEERLLKAKQTHAQTADPESLEFSGTVLGPTAQVAVVLNDVVVRVVHATASDGEEEQEADPKYEHNDPEDDHRELEDDHSKKQDIISADLEEPDDEADTAEDDHSDSDNEDTASVDLEEPDDEADAAEDDHSDKQDTASADLEEDDGADAAKDDHSDSDKETTASADLEEADEGESCFGENSDSGEESNDFGDAPSAIMGDASKDSPPNETNGSDAGSASIASDSGSDEDDVTMENSEERAYEVHVG